MLTKCFHKFKVREAVLRLGVIAWTLEWIDKLALRSVVGLVGAGIVWMSACLGLVHLMLVLEPVLFLQTKLVFLELLAAQGRLIHRTGAGHGHSAWLKVAVSVAHGGIKWIKEKKYE